MSNINLADQLSSGTGELSIPDLFNDFFKDLKSCYPSWRASIKSAEEDKRFKKQWIRAFSENGVVNDKQLAMGLVKARADKSQWLPSAGQFIEWCKPSVESLGLPDERSAYLEACCHAEGSEWSHPAVYFASVGISYDLRARPERVSFPLFKYNYSVVVGRLLAGEDIGVIPKAIEQKEPETEITEEEVNEARQFLKEFIGGGFE